jgi:phytoene desaturase
MTVAATVEQAGAESGSAPAGRHVLIVGAGLGGLSAAVRLRARGYRVTVLERHAHPGGRCGLWESRGFRFDTGPTLLLMLDQIARVFSDAGRRMEDYLEVTQLDPNYRIYYRDGTTLDVTSRINALVENVERIEPGAGVGLLDFLAAAGRMHRTGVAFVDRNVHRARDFFSLRDAGLLAARGALGRLRALVSKHFRDERLRDAFSFQSLYLGLSPFDAMAIYALLPYTEIAGGLYFPKGGMHALPRALDRLATEMGVEIEYEVNVARLETSGGRVSAAILEDGTRRIADLVLVNADLPYAYRTLLGEPFDRSERLRFTCSAFLMYLGVNREYPGLPHHNLIVPGDLAECCRDIFERHRIPRDPAFYVCNPSKTDSELAPPGCENLYVLVPVPSQSPGSEIDWAEEGPRLADEMLDRLDALGLPDVRRHIVTQRLFTPADFREDFSATRGEAFGLSHDFLQVGYFRPHNRHARLRNLFFVGQSTHPGCGVPMAMISSRCTVERMAEEVPA